MGNVSRDSYRLSIDLFVDCMVIRTAGSGFELAWRKWKGLRELGPSGLRVNEGDGFATAVEMCGKSGREVSSE